MRKILLILFLFSLVSGTAFAKVEIWLCETHDPDSYYQIDTDEPAIYFRKYGTWKILGNKDGPASFVYNKEEDNVQIIPRGKSYVSGIFDVVTKEIFWLNPDGTPSNYKGTPCRVWYP